MSGNVQWNGKFPIRPVRPEKWSSLKGGPHFPELFQLGRTVPLSFEPKFLEILVEWIAPKSNFQLAVTQSSFESDNYNAQSLSELRFAVLLCSQTWKIDRQNSPSVNLLFVATQSYNAAAFHQDRSWECTILSPHWVIRWRQKWIRSHSLQWWTSLARIRYELVWTYVVLVTWQK